MAVICYPTPSFSMEQRLMKIHLIPVIILYYTTTNRFLTVKARSLNGKNGKRRLRAE